ncbi:hypothetical protein GTQ40_08830 [Flavobacteriaceae bacterium R38]|nr:hypothetical protein [Flavobacteriaceae bacterium R38]
MRLFLIFLVFAFGFSTDISSQDDDGPKAFISISGTLGKHKINFKNYAKSPGFSFGFSVSAGIYAVDNGDFRGGLVVTLLEGASRDEKRRQLSEDFDIPHKEFDKHIIFKFAQFRSATIGWFSEWDASDNNTLYHQLGFGIFGTTERDQLLDFGMSNQAGILLGDQDSFRARLGATYDTTFGTGNPNYTQNNIGFTFGGFRSF